MDQHKGNIWEWLAENGQSSEDEAASSGAPEPSHKMDDETLLALEREAEAMAKLEAGGGL
jgi:hypothetical protein